MAAVGKRLGRLRLEEAEEVWMLLPLGPTLK